MPALGLGTATLKEGRCLAAIDAAFNAGYRLLDTALLYGNQVEVGEAIKLSPLAREEIWITSKVAFFPPESEGVWMHNANNVKGDEAASIALTLQQLQLSHVDLLLVHNPCALKGEYSAAGLPHFFEVRHSNYTITHSRTSWSSSAQLATRTPSNPRCSRMGQSCARLSCKP